MCSYYQSSTLPYPTPSLSQIDEDKACKDKDDCKSNNPAESTGPPYAIEVKEKVGEPLVASNQVTGVDERYVQIRQKDTALDASYSDLTHRACGEEVDGVEDGGDEVQAYAGPVCPIGCRGGVTQEQVVHGTNDKDGDEAPELPLHQRQGDGLATDETHQLVDHQPKTIEIAQIGEVEEEAGTMQP